MGALTSPLKSGLSGGGQRGGQGHVGEGSVRPTRCELPPLLGVALQPLRPSRLLYQQLGQSFSGGRGERWSPTFQASPLRINSHPIVSGPFGAPCSPAARDFGLISGTRLVWQTQSLATMS